MRVLDEQTLDILWNWGKIEKNELSVKYQTNFIRLLDEIKTRFLEEESIDAETLKNLSDELQEVGLFFDTLSANCFSMVTTFRRMYMDERPPVNHIARLSHAIGKPIILTQTSSKEVEGKIGTIEQINEDQAVVRFGDDLWATSIDRIVTVPSKSVSIEEQTIKSLKPVCMFLRMNGKELTNVLPFLSMTRRTGKLQLKFLENGKIGTFYFTTGRIYNVSFEGLNAADATAYMLTLEEAEAHFFADETIEEKNINLATDQLLIKAAVLADKFIAIREKQNSKKEEEEEELELPASVTKAMNNKSESPSSTNITTNANPTKNKKDYPPGHPFANDKMNGGYVNINANKEKDKEKSDDDNNMPKPKTKNELPPQKPKISLKISPKPTAINETEPKTKPTAEKIPVPVVNNVKIRLKTPTFKP